MSQNQSIPMTGGALLLQSLTYAYGGRNPAAASWWTFLLVAALPGVLAVATVLYEDAVGWAAREGGMARLDEEHGEAGKPRSGRGAGNRFI
jgi:hypothetical protein